MPGMDTRWMSRPGSALRSCYPDPMKHFYSVELPYQPDASACFAAIADLPWAVWLDSCGKGCYDILTAAPQHTLVLDEITQTDPFALLRDALGTRLEPIADLPFAGGALGYWSYDLVRRQMRLPDNSQNDEQPPLMAIGIYDWALVLDHRQRSARLVSHCRYADTEKLLPQILRRLQDGTTLPPSNFRVHGEITSNFTRDRYEAAFAEVHRHLQDGDCYQINLAQRFSARAEGDALGAYLSLRQLNPAPYSAFLNLPQIQILCASPECFLNVRNGRVKTMPIKGTRPRSNDIERDLQLAEELRLHPKDRAENLMIVDLLRNDLGKNCMPGSVCVPKMFEVESYANVHHLVSTVEGTLAPGHDALDLLRDCFPGGSVTGAPKQRAMQIIEQLEPHRRGVYCGAIGYIGFDGNMDTNIAIRTMVYSGNEVCLWAGGGIVADSDVATEFSETLDKASGMLEVLRQFGGEFIRKN